MEINLRILDEISFADLVALEKVVKKRADVNNFEYSFEEHINYQTFWMQSEIT